MIKNFGIIFAIIIILLLMVNIYNSQLDFPNKNETEITVLDNNKKIIINPEIELKIEEEGAKLPVNQIQTGCPFKDCIESIDDPKFESTTQANEWLDDSDRIFVLTRNEITKIYPQRILNWHEIVNDWFDDQPISVSFCPLCGTAMAFTREVNGIITEFGVSGKLHNSDLIMYDRYEGSLWQQATGEAITGPAARRNEFLTPLFLVTLDWKQAREEFPNSLVLSKETGFIRDYSSYPYGNYEINNDVGFGAPTDDKRLEPKEWIYGLKIGENSKAYKEQDLQKISAIKDTVGDSTIMIKNSDGIISFSNLDTKEEIVSLRSFWFAWAAFNPSTDIFSP